MEEVSSWVVWQPKLQDSSKPKNPNSDPVASDFITNQWARLQNMNEALEKMNDIAEQIRASLRQTTGELKKLREEGEASKLVPSDVPNLQIDEVSKELQIDHGSLKVIPRLSNAIVVKEALKELGEFDGVSEDLIKTKIVFQVFDEMPIRGFNDSDSFIHLDMGHSNWIFDPGGFEMQDCKERQIFGSLNFSMPLLVSSTTEHLNFDCDNFFEFCGFAQDKGKKLISIGKEMEFLPIPGATVAHARQQKMNELSELSTAPTKFAIVVDQALAVIFVFDLGGICKLQFLMSDLASFDLVRMFLQGHRKVWMIA